MFVEKAETLLAIARDIRIEGELRERALDEPPPLGCGRKGLYEDVYL